MTDRLSRFRVLFPPKVDVVYLTNPVSISYFSGFKGVSQVEREATLVVTKRSATLLLPQMYEQQGKKIAKKTDIKIELIDSRDKFMSVVKKCFKDKKIIGVETNHLTVGENKRLTREFKIKIEPIEEFVSELRMVKDEEEIEKCKKAIEVTESALRFVIENMRTGTTEKYLAKMLADFIVDQECELAFDPIVAFGKNSAIPHHVSDNTKIDRRGILLVDLGAKYQGYCGDLTRTYHPGKADDKFIDTYKLLFDVQNLVLDAVKPGVKLSDLWGILEKGMGKEIKNMPHSLGHGIGLEIHEAPGIHAKSDVVLKSGMVISIEPGLYYPGWGGIRIEDYVLVTEEGCEVLSKTDKELNSIMT